MVPLRDRSVVISCCSRLERIVVSFVECVVTTVAVFVLAAVIAVIVGAVT